MIPPPTAKPLEVKWHQISGVAPASTTLLVLLPGRHSRREDFEENGILSALRPNDRFDAVTTDLHLGYYKDRNLDVKLREAVFEPARRKGYRRIELVGISLGGLGALIYDSKFPGEVDRIVLLSPYTGEKPILDEIRNAGGLVKWEPGTVAEGGRNQDRRIWSMWKSSPPSSSRIVLAVGASDKFREANSFFAREFLGGRMTVVEGGHDWPTWCEMFRRTYAQPSASAR